MISVINSSILPELTVISPHIVLDIRGIRLSNLIIAAWSHTTLTFLRVKQKKKYELSIKEQYRQPILYNEKRKLRSEFVDTQHLIHRAQKDYINVYVFVFNIATAI